MLRSVDSECVGRVIEPRKHNSRGSRHCRESGRQHRGAVVAERQDSAGVEEHGTFMRGAPGTWEILSSPPRQPVWGTPVNKPRPAGAAPCACGSEAQGAAAVPPSEGNEVRWDGRQEDGVLRSTEETGEPTRGTPGREATVLRVKREGCPQVSQALGLLEGSRLWTCRQPCVPRRLDMAASRQFSFLASR
jgi:hypothetical protein